MNTVKTQKEKMCMLAVLADLLLCCSWM